MHLKKRPVAIALVVVAVGLVATLVIALVAGTEKVQSHYQDSLERQNYEAALMADAGRVDATFGTIVDDATGKLYTAYLKDRTPCDRQCMTFRQVDGGYAVTLPVAYSYAAGSKSFGSPYERGNITTLTYWDPAVHQPRTLTAAAGESIVLPDVLRDRKITAVQQGETVYTSPAYIRMGADGRIRVIDFVSVRREPGGSRYGLVDLARLTRTSDGFIACLPPGHNPLTDGTINSQFTVTLEVGC